MMLGAGLLQALPGDKRCNESGPHGSGDRIKGSLLSHVQLHKLVRLQKVQEALCIKACCELKNTIPALLIIFKNTKLTRNSRNKGPEVRC